MDRLTARTEGGQAIVKCAACELRGHGCSAYNCRNRLKDRLAEYEDRQEARERRKRPPVDMEMLEESGFEI